ncbi:MULTISPECIES: ATP phosphoribosyltransferase regulatory subunit [Staphylococcus]|uniref:ATP phosphoribosyltransferase regulatory subunit n=1 Tax=Staphylococcus TaxID=1279 RepID=UPI000CD14AFC|nr:MULTISPECIES: ATP phosphoribosyltransferase regulatory subunit [Staphylococcus]MBX5318818.1 ATP phosphoribosyltransferase regulatory subunit [Staphylococcus caprae]MCR6086599.1 ATP phosphoribosyltransferase regulatory subunit [Staphylococcus aureus]MDI9230691.1 ATP phosphoribosyltransferase regulatory subunit [Staphylococcus caprae]POA04637.1 ATP phosphoribosyltransferase regulatory subunit [Staphylococcus caprae]SUL94397.1 ATP phosphoribosyltransferase [Staphylococcus caprae]
MSKLDIISIKEKELAFLKYFKQQGYQLVDFNLIEKLNWGNLTHEDLQQMEERHFWQHHKHLYALRNDFTDQLFRYYSAYPSNHQQVAYAGDIIRNNKVIKQIGIENYHPSREVIKNSFIHFHKFIKSGLHDRIQFVILGHYQLIDALLDQQFQTPDVVEMIEERNISGLVNKLGVHHPLIRILKENTLNQLQLLPNYLSANHPALQTLQLWEGWLKSWGLKDIHLDITAQPPRSYYKGVFIKCHLEHSHESVLTGGYYHGELEGFGLGLTL